MKKLFFILFSVTIVSLGAFYLALSNSASILSKIFSEKMRTEVEINEMCYKPHSFSINGIQIANPNQARDPIALTVQTIDVETPYHQYLGNPIVIDSIEIDHVYVNIQLYNKDQTEGNWQTLIHNMEGNKQTSLLKAWIVKNRVAIIKKLTFKDIKIDLILADGSTHSLSPIKKLEFHDVHSDEGIPSQEISDIIIQKMIHSIFIENGLKTIIEAPVKILKGVLPFF